MPENSLHKKSKIVFYQIGGLGLGIGVLISFLAFNLYSKLFLLWQIFLKKLEAFCGCSNHLSFWNHPILFSSLFLLGLILAFFLAFIFVRIIKLKIATQRFVKNYLAFPRQNICLKLKRIALQIGLRDKIIEIENSQPIIFCFGYLKPKICVSSGLIRKLTEAELKAVLLHEQYHLASRQPLKIFLVEAINRILFFIPLVKLLAKKYLTFSELAADEKATNGFRDKTSLAKALYKILRWKERQAIIENLTVSFFNATHERIHKLADQRYLPKFQYGKLGLVLSLFTIFSILFLPNILDIQTRSVFATHGPDCLFSHTPENKCQMVSEQSFCSLDRLNVCPLTNICLPLGKSEKLNCE